jgi:hypothetical protein
MIRHLYVSTVDSKGRPHSYKIRDDEPLPEREEVVDLKVAGQVGMRDLVRPEQQEALRAMFGGTNAKQRRRSRRAPA